MKCCNIFFFFFKFKVETLLEYHVHWIEESPPLFSQERGQWLFALLTKVRISNIDL